MKRLALPTILLAAGALLASGCVYKMNIQQGNYLVADSVSQLKEGMTRSQVRFLLGTPWCPTPSMTTGGTTTTSSARRRFKEPLKRRLTVYFEDDKVVRYENLGVPTQADLAQLERDLRKAQSETKGKKQGFWGRTSGTETAETPPAPARYFGGREGSRSCAAFRALARSRRDSFGSALRGR